MEIINNEATIELMAEALIFASEQSMEFAEIKFLIENVLGRQIEEETLRQVLKQIENKYAGTGFAIGLFYLNNGYQFLTKKNYHQVIGQLEALRSKKKLSQAALETLAIIAYRQPVTKTEIEQIRGVNSDYSVQKLLEKELISISGKAKTVGNPVLYSTSNLFMDYFGISTIADLPQLKEIVFEDGSNSYIGGKPI